jgi:hypothetical protein
VKQQCRRLFSPILNKFESGSESYLYKASHRTILIVMGCLFCGLATAVFVLGRGEELTYLLPVLVFGGAGLLSVLIGWLGNDRAVAKIWGSR